MAYPTVNAGDEILEAHYNAIVGSLTGTSGKGQQILLTDYSSADNYSFTVKNPGSGGKAVNIKAANGNDIATFNDSAVTLKSQDGTRIVAISNSGVSITAPSQSFSINGQTVGAGIRVYNVLDHGIVTGTTSTNAAANTTALAALWDTVAAAGGGTIYWPEGEYPLNATTLDHELSSNPSMNMLGDGSASLIRFYGTTGPFLNVASGSTSSIARCIWRDLQFRHGATPTSGATLYFGYTQQITLDNIRIPAASASLASFNCLKIGASANGFSILNSKFELQTTGAIVPIGIDVATSGSADGGLVIINTDISGYSSASIGLRFVNTTLWDTVWLGPGTNFKDHDTCLLKTGGAGGVSNLIANGAVFDGADIDIHLDAPASSSCENWLFNGCWMSGNNYNVILAESTGTVNNVQFVGCYLTSADTTSVSIGAGVEKVILKGNIIASDQTTDWVVDVTGAAVDVLIVGNIMSVANAAGGLIRINASCDPVLVDSNILRGGADADGLSFGGAADASRVSGTNAYQAL